MSIRSVVVAPILFAAVFIMAPVYGHAFSLSHLLGGEEQDLTTFKVIHVADLKAMLAQRANKVHLYDANVAATRERFGTIPGASLLASDENYPLSVLPPNKHAQLVFYCANNH